VQAAASAATEIGKVIWPRVKAKLNFVLDKADELNKRKNASSDLNVLLKDTSAHFKKVKEEKQASTDSAKTAPGDSVVDPTTEVKSST